MDKLINVWNKESREKGWKYKGIVLAFYDEDIVYPPTLIFQPVLRWLDYQDDETFNAIAHVLIDEDEKILNVFFKNSEKTLKGGAVIPRGYKIEIFENFPYGASTTGNIWHSYDRDYWQDNEPVDWGEHKSVWGDLKRKDIWG